MSAGYPKKLRSSSTAPAVGDSKPAARKKSATAAVDNSGASSSPLDQGNDPNNGTFKVNLSMDRNIFVTAYGTDGALANEAETHIKAANELPFYSNSEEESHYKGGNQCANPGIDPSHIYGEPPLLIQRRKLTFDQCMVNVAIFASLAEDRLKELDDRICWGCKSLEHRFFQCPSKNDPMVQALGVAGYRALLAVPAVPAVLAVPQERKRKFLIYNISREPAPASSPDGSF